MKSFSSLFLLPLILAILFFIFSSPTHAAVCIPSGNETAIQNALQGTAAEAVLCQNATFSITQPIVFNASNQKVYTEGNPTGNNRALLKLTNAQYTYIFDGRNRSGIQIRNLRLDGNRVGLGFRQNSGDFAVIEMGGNATGQIVDSVDAYDTRSWSLIHVAEGSVGSDGTYGCQNATITNNTLGPAGWSYIEWSDGVSLACGNSLVANNYIFDVTDAGVAVFGSHGSRIENNTIKAINRVMLGGVTMVDFNPSGGNFTNTSVTGNQIIAESSFIKIGIAQGPPTWGCSDNVNRGAVVTNNIISGAYIGYGMSVNGVSNWTVSGNQFTGSNAGVIQSGSCGFQNTQPTQFIKQNAGGSFQPEFTEGSNELSVRMITHQESSWVPPHCSGQQFRGCSIDMGARCTDMGNANYAHWSSSQTNTCNEVCQRADPNTYCLEQPTPTPTPTGGSSPTPTPTPTPTPQACVVPSTPTNLQPSGTTTPGSKNITWNAVTGAARYAIRIDDQGNPWNGSCTSPNTGDVCNDSVSTNSFPFNFVSGKKYNIWVHAVNSCGVFSGASPQVVTVSQASQPTPTPTQSGPMPTGVPSSTTTLNPIADTFVFKDQPTVNFGTRIAIEVDGSPVKLAFLRFDLSPFSGRTISSAKLRLRVTDSSGSTQNIKDVASITWSETGMTYNNRPALGATQKTFNNSSSGAWKEIDITPYIRAKLGQIVSIGIDSTGSDGLDFASRESGNKPQLILQ